MKHYNRYKAQRKRNNDKASISSNDTCAIMDKYMDGDILGMKAMTTTQQRIFEPFRKKTLSPQQTFLKRIPNAAYKDLHKSLNVTTIHPMAVTSSTDIDQTPTEAENTITADLSANEHLTVRRQLFVEESTGDLSGLSQQQNGEKVTEWLLSHNKAQCWDKESTSSTTLPNEERYGFCLPPWLQSDDAPKLVSEKRPTTGIPVTEEKRMAVARDNHDIVRRWLMDCRIRECVGSGREELQHQAIQASADKCEFRQEAEQILSTMPTIKRYAVDKYIDELKLKEKQAVTTARIFRNKLEDSEKARTDEQQEANEELLRVRTFWRKAHSRTMFQGWENVTLVYHEEH